MCLHSIQNIFFCFTCRRRRTLEVRMKPKMTQDKDMLEIQWQPQIMNPSLSEKQLEQVDASKLKVER